MRKKRNKTLEIILIIIIIILLLLGGIFLVVLLSKDTGMRYYNVILSGNSGELSLTANSNNLAPNREIVSKPILVNVTPESESAYIRAKIIFENDS